METTMRKALTTVLLALFTLTGLPAMATDYPSKTIRLIVPFPPGGPTDGLARHLAQGLGTELGTSVIVENKAGAGGNIGSQYVATADPDGHTLLFGTSGPQIGRASCREREWSPR